MRPILSMAKLARGRGQSWEHVDSQLSLLVHLRQSNMLLLFTGSLITAKLPLVYKNKPHRVESLHPTLSETALYKGLLLHQPT